MGIRGQHRKKKSEILGGPAEERSWRRAVLGNMGSGGGGGGKNVEHALKNVEHAPKNAEHAPKKKVEHALQKN